MTELAIKRVVIAYDGHGNMEIAVREAALLAARWRVPLHGVFLTGENVLRLAELPLAAMRRAIEAAARDQGLDWSFAEIRELPGAVSGAAAEGDILMVDAGIGPLSGSWRPRSPWEGTASELGSIVLLRRTEGQRRPAIALVLDGNDDGHERTLAALRSLAGPRDRLHVAVLGGGGTGSHETLARQFARAGLANVAVERFPNHVALRRFLVRFQPGLAAIETRALDRAELKALVADTHCDLLLIAKA
jgi:hypothetical protein